MWGRGGQTGGVFQTCKFNIQQPSSKIPAVHAKKRTNKFLSCQVFPAGNVTALSQKNKACLVSVLSKGLLIQTKEKYSHLEGVIGRGWEWWKQSSDGKS